MQVDADQLVIASQATALERLATGAMECISDGPTIVPMVVLQHDDCAAHVRHNRLGKK
jgi:hypothetical protein